MRSRLASEGELFDGYHPEMEAVHVRNGQRLSAIIDEYGWPTRAMVGEEGVQAAWLVAQHAISLPALQRRVLPLVRAAADIGEIEPQAVAMLEDRIAFFERRPQRYGTQFDWDEDEQMAPWSIADPDRVDELRASVGLESLAERAASIRADLAGEHPPDELENRQAEFEAWRRKVGWA